ncbi:MAG: PIN domain-containing protein [Spirochaetales bacterium]|nr:PIN domain-containing protein [Spirochaetales bacterium]
MINLFIDSDIIIDLLAKRNEYESAAALFSLMLAGKLTGFTTPLVMANVYCIISKHNGRKQAIEKIRKLRKILSILAINEEIFDEALGHDSIDFEDAIQYKTAERNSIDCIITRNKKDYKNSRIPVKTATEIIRII